MYDFFNKTQLKQQQLQQQQHSNNTTTTKSIYLMNKKASKAFAKKKGREWKKSGIGYDNEDVQ